MRTLYDAVDWRNIPDSAEMVAGYIDGRFTWNAAGWERFADRPRVQLTTSPWHDAGHVLVVEYGSAIPEEAPDWCVKAHKRGVTPCVYVAWDRWALLRGTFESRGIAPPLWWVRRLDGAHDVITGAVAKQYKAAGVYDVSAVLDYWPGVDKPKG